MAACSAQYWYSRWSIPHKHSTTTQTCRYGGRRSCSGTAVTTALSKARELVIYTISRTHRAS